MTAHTSVTGETPQFLIRAHGVTGFAAHIPNSDGEPICKLKLNMSRWQIEECPLPPRLVCHRCTSTQLLQAWKTLVTFWCEHGSHEVTEEHGPGQLPRYCAEHTTEAQRALTRVQLKARQERTRWPRKG